MISKRETIDLIYDVMGIGSEVESHDPHFQQLEGGNKIAETLD